jgi:hypothetical protein
MRHKGWVLTMLLVPLLAQATAVTSPGACSISGSGSASAPAHAVLGAGQSGNHHGTMTLPVDSPDMQQHDSAMHQDSALLGAPDCCMGAKSGGCSNDVCQMGGCAAAYLLPLDYEIAVPAQAAQPIIHAVSPQSPLVFAPFRPPIA